MHRCSVGMFFLASSRWCICCQWPGSPSCRIQQKWLLAGVPRSDVLCGRVRFSAEGPGLGLLSPCGKKKCTYCVRICTYCQTTQHGKKYQKPACVYIYKINKKLKKKITLKKGEQMKPRLFNLRKYDTPARAAALAGQTTYWRQQRRLQTQETVLARPSPGYSPGTAGAVGPKQGCGPWRDTPNCTWSAQVFIMARQSTTRAKTRKKIQTKAGSASEAGNTCKLVLKKTLKSHNGVLI